MSNWQDDQRRQAQERERVRRQWEDHFRDRDLRHNQAQRERDAQDAGGTRSKRENLGRPGRRGSSLGRTIVLALLLLGVWW